MPDLTRPPPARPAHPTVVLTVLCLAQLMVILDVTIVNVSLASIQDDLGLSAASLQYVVTSYLVTLGGFLLVAGRCADLFGRRSTLIAGTAVFTVASLAAALAQSAWQLLIPRAVQGIGGALITTSALSMLTTVFVDGAARNRALGIWGAVTGAGSALGVILGGALTDGPGWRWIFWINVPIGVAAIVVARRVLPVGERDRSTRLDAPGAVTLTAALVVLVMSIARTELVGWMSASTIGGFTAVVALLGVFVAIEARSPQPLVDIGIFRHRQLRAANLVALCVFAAMTAMFFVASMMMQRVLGFTPLKTGAVYVPLSLCFLAGAQVASRLLQRYSPRQMLTAALPAAAVGFAMLARVPADGSYLADLLGPTVLIGLALGATMVPIQVAAFAGIDATDSGLAAGLVTTSQEVGGALGVAILTTLAISRTQHTIAGGSSELDALRIGYQHALVGGAALLGVALVITLALLDRPARQRVRADDPGPAITRLQPTAYTPTRRSPPTIRPITRGVPSNAHHQRFPVDRRPGAATR